MCVSGMVVEAQNVCKWNGCENMVRVVSGTALECGVGMAPRTLNVGWL